jgi:hypothetical protein
MDTAPSSPGSPDRFTRIVRLDPPEIIAARVIHDLAAARLSEIETDWNPARTVVAHTHPGAEHTHWDWRNKAESVAAGVCRLVAIQHDGQTQGLMAVSTGPRPGALAGPGRSILYVDYVEVAPWNLRLPAQSPRFTGVGKALLAEAVRLSVASGFMGRVGLHSLPQAEAFYAAGCGMTRTGPDAGYHNLVYFEYTEGEAARFLTGVEL